MGLRTASVRRPHVAVMAPALTETTQAQNFNLPPKAHLEPASPINSYQNNTKYQANAKNYCQTADRLSPFHLDGDELNNIIGNLNTSALTSEKIILGKCLIELSGASDNTFNEIPNIMSGSPSPMGDQGNKMGLQKTGIDVSNIHKSKNASDMDQLFNNFSSVLPEGESGCAPGDLGQNVEDIMQVIKSIEGGERLNNIHNDLNSENDEVFPMAGTDLTNNLTSFEKELLEGVDMMNMTMEDQQDELETVDKQKESQARDVLAELHKKHAKVERRLDFLRRRVYKLQSKFMGQHISGEIAGVFENVHRSLKRTKELHETSKLDTLGTMAGNEITNVEKVKPMSYGSAKILVRKLEMSSILQANTASRQRNASKYFGSGSIEMPPFRSNVTGMISVPPWPTETKYELQKVAGQLQTQLSLVQKEVDSEATESSSGGESCDEMQTYNNPHQQYLSIQKRALWKYTSDRAAIAARWTWLQAQIADLEYRIRQHTDLHKQIRASKGSVQLAPPSPPPPSSPTTVNGYRGQLPGGSPRLSADCTIGSKTAVDCAIGPKVAADCAIGPKVAADCVNSCSTEYQCARTRCLVNFRKRKLLQISGLHAVSKKAARPSTMRCGCVPLSMPCALCTGRTDPTHPRDPPDTLSKSERIALLDPCFHPVFSLPEDTSQNIHLEAIMKTSEWQQRSTRIKTLKVLSKSERLEPKSLDHRTKKLEHRKKYGRLLKPTTMSALTAKIKNKIRGRKAGRHALNRLHRKRHTAKEAIAQLSTLNTDYADEEVESIGDNSIAGTRSLDSPSTSPLLQMQSISGYSRRNRIHSYDIDNIVIPYSVAASTRVEKLQYKEILTPKWRIAESEFYKFEPKDNGATIDPSQDSDTEDMSEEATVARHDRCEHDEKRRFLSYLRPPLGCGRGRVHKRTDSRAESSGANTPDAMSPQPAGGGDLADGVSPAASPPATPLPVVQPEDAAPLPSVAVLRRRTISQSRFLRDREVKDEQPAPLQDVVEVPPYERRTFPITDDTYDRMLRHMPENHQFATNARAQDSPSGHGGDSDCALPGYSDRRRPESPDSESTESAVGDGDEDPNDPEWVDAERANRERHKR